MKYADRRREKERQTGDKDDREYIRHMVVLQGARENRDVSAYAG